MLSGVLPDPALWHGDGRRDPYRIRLNGGMPVRCSRVQTAGSLAEFSSMYPPVLDSRDCLRLRALARVVRVARNDDRYYRARQVNRRQRPADTGGLTMAVSLWSQAEVNASAFETVPLLVINIILIVLSQPKHDAWFSGSLLSSPDGAHVLLRRHRGATGISTKSLIEGTSSLYPNLLLAAAYLTIQELVLRWITRSSDVGQCPS